MKDVFKIYFIAVEVCGSYSDMFCRCTGLLYLLESSNLSIYCNFLVELTLTVQFGDKLVSPGGLVMFAGVLSVIAWNIWGK